MDSYSFDSAPPVRETTPSPARTRSAATQPFQTPYRVLSNHRPLQALLPHPPLIPRRHRLALGAPHHPLVRPPAAFPSDLSWSPYTILFLNDPGPIKTIVQSARCTPSRNASYGSVNLQRHETESIARGVLPHIDAPLFGRRCRR